MYTIAAKYIDIFNSLGFVMILLFKELVALLK